ncbi:MAG: hypothetical protein MUF46_08990, partial [Desulfobacterales bacterium]|nr:hypothetical protein [Desulfobacterales bacterium]
FDAAALIGRELLPLPVALLIAVPILRRHALQFIHAPAQGIFLLGRQGLPFLVLALHPTPVFGRWALSRARREKPAGGIVRELFMQDPTGESQSRG